MLGSGGLQYIHNCEHQRDHARHAAMAAEHGLPLHPTPLPDDTNCQIHAQLHLPVISLGWVPLLVCLGLFVAFLTLLTPEPVSHRPILSLPCRGPPAC
jgi:hypothetical protein